MAVVQKSESIQEAVYRELKRGIMTLRLEPGSTMSTQEMADRLNVSRTPVREAFLQLQQEGLVESISQRGTIVSLINTRRVNQECFVRHGLEHSVIGRFIDRSTGADFERLRRLNEEQLRYYLDRDWENTMISDQRFHRVLFEAAEEMLAWEIIATKNGHYDRARLMVIRTEDVSRAVYGQHNDLIEALEKRDEKAAQSILYNHINGNRYERLFGNPEFGRFFTDGTEETGMKVRPL